MVPLFYSIYTTLLRKYNTTCTSKKRFQKLNYVLRIIFNIFKYFKKCVTQITCCIKITIVCCNVDIRRRKMWRMIFQQNTKNTKICYRFIKILFLEETKCYICALKKPKHTKTGKYLTFLKNQKKHILRIRIVSMVSVYMVG